MSDPILYGIFAVIAVVLLAVDLFVVQRDSHAVTIREAGMWSAIWVGVALLFGVFIALFRDAGSSESVIEYFTGYVIEWSLSVDNVFLFVLIFQSLAVPREYQHRVLFYGVAGAIVMRTVLILIGAEIVERFAWVLAIFGAFLVYTGVQTWRQRNQHPDISDSKLLHRIRGRLPTTDRYHGEQFLAVEDGRRVATPLLIVLILVEFSDLIFAMDSIPAIFGITQDPFIVLTSNIFAVLGLRSLYFLLAGVADKLRYLKAGLAVILTFVGVKILLEQTPYEGLHISPLVSLGVVMSILAATVLVSLRAGPLPEGETPGAGLGDLFESEHQGPKVP